MSTLPAFTQLGLLPPGDYPLTLDELRESMLVRGPAQAPSQPAWETAWDADWRLELVNNLAALVPQLWAVGIDEIFIDGSFVEDKDHPNDIDGYFVCDPHRFASGELEHELNKLDPRKCWTWADAARTRSLGSAKRQLPMWHAYSVELYPHFAGLIAAVDTHGHPLEFPAFFRKTRADDRPKGIVRITKTTQHGATP